MAAPKNVTPARLINHLRKAEVEPANGQLPPKAVFLSSTGARNSVIGMVDWWQAPWRDPGACPQRRSLFEILASESCHLASES